MKRQRWIVGISGASGVIYGVELCRQLLKSGLEVHLIISDAGWRVLSEELGWAASKRAETIAAQFAGYEGKLHYHNNQDIGASVASGSFRVDGMVIIPCSMGTLSSIACGASDNLLERAADVVLKESKRLVVVPRETPLHAIHLENMLKLARMNAIVLPAMPAFYGKPETIRDLVLFIVGKTMDSMGLEDHAIYPRWGESQS